ncbi:hypothetical protein EIN_083610 [Entamoeba invadens IP1]|uniref:hypothetical protein n=1 Tax=Entamoeba invadens IP1 TaxID=370355 RepID=UPI0002C3E814|nr:hypothetical protein EIN_083610 [Entamoeba invadens IP1]ELP85219.1 hypothetical protein EIN_083610 [Entamoeba invadens IP1]|eukprot:XP_004184565.1 hypothetical protein EIN_083610 [Entamoeba invadens IP1]
METPDMVKEIYIESLRRRKRVSRNEETTIANGLIYMIIKLGFNIKIKRTKKTVHTKKMLIVEEMVHRGTGKVLNQHDVAKYSRCLLDDIGKPHLDESAMTLKQFKRSREAQISNSLLFFLKMVGFSFEEKKTKKAKYTEKLIRVSQLSYKEQIISFAELETFAEALEQVAEQKLGERSFIEITEKDLQKEEGKFVFPTVSFTETLNMKSPEETKNENESVIDSTAFATIDQEKQPLVQNQVPQMCYYPTENTLLQNSAIQPNVGQVVTCFNQFGQPMYFFVLNGVAQAMVPLVPVPSTLGLVQMNVSEPDVQPQYDNQMTGFEQY